ncbi:MAG: hypothetical protein U5K69_27245 [Balneolaceae bacterium]|nr:hypothetical protein [Balneolaceae bacterium]
MDIKEKTHKQLTERIEKLEAIIAEKGVGSRQLQKAKRAQRDLNLALILGTATALVGLAAWKVLKSD